MTLPQLKFRKYQTTVQSSSLQEDQIVWKIELSMSGRKCWTSIAVLQEEDILPAQRARRMVAANEFPPVQYKP